VNGHNEIIGVENFDRSLLLIATADISDTSSMADFMHFQREKLFHLVSKKEHSKMRLKSVMSNREMLTRMIFDHTIALEALKVTKQAHQYKLEKLVEDLHELLNAMAVDLGKLSWKNAVFHSCNEIAPLAKTR
jgi:hypothetical protein